MSIFTYREADHVPPTYRKHFEKKPQLKFLEVRWYNIDLKGKAKRIARNVVTGKYIFDHLTAFYPERFGSSNQVYVQSIIFSLFFNFYLKDHVQVIHEDMILLGFKVPKKSVQSDNKPIKLSKADIKRTNDVIETLKYMKEDRGYKRKRSGLVKQETPLNVDNVIRFIQTLAAAEQAKILSSINSHPGCGSVSDKESE